MSSVCYSYVLVCHSHVTRMYSYVIRISLLCTRMSSVCHSYVLVCHLYVTRMYSHVIRMSLVCTRMAYVCHSYVPICRWYVTRMWFYHEPFKNICFTLSSKIMLCYLDFHFKQKLWGKEHHYTRLKEIYLIIMLIKMKLLIFLVFSQHGLA